MTLNVDHFNTVNNAVNTVNSINNVSTASTMNSANSVYNTRQSDRLRTNQIEAISRKRKVSGRSVTQLNDDAQDSADESVQNLDQNKKVITEQFLQKCKTDFQKSPEKVIIRNAIVTVGLELAATDQEEVQKIDHVFLNTLKSSHARATDQGASGRCWLFAGLNTLRHFVIKVLDMKNFEFSVTYLYFFDKIERSNVFLNEMIEKLETPLTDRYLHHRIESPIEDGGYWSYFKNLVMKYGLVPKDTMNETFHSGNSEEINNTINSILRSAACQLRENKHKMSDEDRQILKDKINQQIYDAMVFFLGKPPETFTWSFQNKEHEAKIFPNITPKMFQQIATGGIDLNNFIVLTHFPSKEKNLNHHYQIHGMKNVAESSDETVFNTSIEVIRKYTSMQLERGMPVWFAADVQRGFHFYHGVLDEKLINKEMIFGKQYPLDKKKRLEYRDTSCCHAMTFTGVDLEEHGKPIKWQVENSWGYYDEDTPGFDGFLTMTNDWFSENVFEVVIYKPLLSRAFTKIVDKATTTVIEPWDPMTVALKLS